MKPLLCAAGLVIAAGIAVCACSPEKAPTSPPKQVEAKEPAIEPDKPFVPVVESDQHYFSAFSEQAEAIKKRAEESKMRTEMAIRQMENEGQEREAPAPQPTAVDAPSPETPDAENLLYTIASHLDNKRFEQAAKLIDEVSKLSLTAEQQTRLNDLRQRHYRESAESANGF
jgi:hypothetical protein